MAAQMEHAGLDWRRGKPFTERLEREKEADQHRTSVEIELRELMEQDRRRADEDLEFRARIR